MPGNRTQDYISDNLSYQTHSIDQSFNYKFDEEKNRFMEQNYNEQLKVWIKKISNKGKHVCTYIMSLQ